MFFFFFSSIPINDCSFIYYLIQKSNRNIRTHTVIKATYFQFIRNIYVYKKYFKINFILLMWSLRCKWNDRNPKKNRVKHVMEEGNRKGNNKCEKSRLLLVSRTKKILGLPRLEDKKAYFSSLIRKLRLKWTEITL